MSPTKQASKKPLTNSLTPAVEILYEDDEPFNVFDVNFKKEVRRYFKDHCAN